jgi:hypothetical protein
VLDWQANSVEAVASVARDEQKPCKRASVMHVWQ